jgi:hypothetical protein
MIYLLGTQHSIQTEQKAPGQHLSDKLGRFRTFVKSAAQSKRVYGIAEESNDEIENIRGNSIARLVAESGQPPLIYIPCEPNTQERRALGIADDPVIHAPHDLSGQELEVYRDAELLRYFPAREKFWIERLHQFPLASVLFILGANHVRTFACRLVENGIPWHIVSFDWVASDDREHGQLPLDQQSI